MNYNKLINNTNELNCIENLNIEVINIFEHTYQDKTFLRLKDGRIASWCEDKTIRIYNPYNDYNCDQVIQRHSEDIMSISELVDETIVSCSDDKSIMIVDYTIKNAHRDLILKVITLPNNRIASCSWDKTIKIWKSNKPYSSTPIKVWFC